MLLDVFEYNQHFVAMMNIINMARLNPPESGDKHHIIPNCWFKINNLPIDNSKDNLVLLSYEDHVKVHKLAYMCPKCSTFKCKMAYAYHRLTQCDVVSNDCFKGEKNPFYGKHHSEEQCKKWSEMRKGMPSGNKGKKASEDTKRKISEAQKGKHHSEETRRKMSESHKGKNNPLFGKNHSEETRKKISEKMKGRTSSLKNRTWKLIDGKRVWIPKE